MKLTSRSLIFFIFFQVSFLSLRSQTFLTSLGDGYFFEGIKGVYNEIQVLQVYPNTHSVEFYATSPDYKTLYNSFIDDDFSDGITWGIDMGALPAGAIIYVGYFDSNDNFISHSRDELKLNILTKPHWLKEYGTVSNVVVNKSIGTISFTGIYPIYNLPTTTTIDNVIKGIGGKKITVAGDFIFQAVFNYKNRSTNVGSSRAFLKMNLLSIVPDYQKEIIFSNNVFLDQNLNLAFKASRTISTEPINLTIPRIKFPVSGVTISLDAGFSLYTTLKGQLIIGESQGQWGFINTGTDKSGIYAILNGEGFIRGEVSVLGGAVSANASLRAKARFGVGFDYVSIPNRTLTPTAAGDIKISGELLIKTFWGLGPSKKFISPSFYYGKFGDTSILNSSLFFRDAQFNTQSLTYRDTGTLVLPQFSPQPKFKTKGDKLNAVWVEKESELSFNGYLLFARLNTGGTSFEGQVLVESNNRSISNPQVGILPSGSALITWTQNIYDATTAPIGVVGSPFLVQFKSRIFSCYTQAIGRSVAEA